MADNLCFSQQMPNVMAINSASDATTGPSCLKFVFDCVLVVVAVKNSTEFIFLMTYSSSYKRQHQINATIRIVYKQRLSCSKYILLLPQFKLSTPVTEEPTLLHYILH